MRREFLDRLFLRLILQSCLQVFFRKWAEFGAGLVQNDSCLCHLGSRLFCRQSIQPLIQFSDEFSLFLNSFLCKIFLLGDQTIRRGVGGLLGLGFCDSLSIKKLLGGDSYPSCVGEFASLACRRSCSCLRLEFFSQPAIFRDFGGQFSGASRPFWQFIGKSFDLGLEIGERIDSVPQKVFEFLELGIGWDHKSGLSQARQFTLDSRFLLIHRRGHLVQLFGPIPSTCEIS